MNAKLSDMLAGFRAAHKMTTKNRKATVIVATATALALFGAMPAANAGSTTSYGPNGTKVRINDGNDIGINNHNKSNVTNNNENSNANGNYNGNFNTNDNGNFNGNYNTNDNTNNNKNKNRAKNLMHNWAGNASTNHPMGIMKSGSAPNIMYNAMPSMVGGGSMRHQYYSLDNN